MDQSNRCASALREEIKPVRMEGNGKWGLLQREQGKTRLMAGYWPDGRQSSKKVFLVDVNMWWEDRGGWCFSCSGRGFKSDDLLIILIHRKSRSR